MAEGAYATYVRDLQRIMDELQTPGATITQDDVYFSPELDSMVLQLTVTYPGSQLRIRLDLELMRYSIYFLRGYVARDAWG